MAAASPNEPNKNFQKPLATLHENIAEHMASQVSIVNTIEGMQMAVEDFSEHVDHCNGSFKLCIMDKVKSLKQQDTTILTDRVGSSTCYSPSPVLYLG